MVIYIRMEETENKIVHFTHQQSKLSLSNDDAFFQFWAFKLIICLWVQEQDSNVSMCIFHISNSKI